MKHIISTIFFVSSIFQLSAQGPLLEWATQIDAEDGGLITVDNDGNIYTLGEFTGTFDVNPGPGVVNLTSAGAFDIFLSKTDSSGNFIWGVKMGGTASESAQDIVFDSFDNIYLTGTFGSLADFDPGPANGYLLSAGGEDVFLVKLNKAGVLVWAKRIGGSSNDKVYAMNIDSDRNIYILPVYSQVQLILIRATVPIIWMRDQILIFLFQS